MNFMNVLKDFSESTDNRELLDGMYLLEETDQFFRSVSIDLYTVKQAIASGDTTTVRMIHRYYRTRAQTTEAYEMRGVKKSTLDYVCVILDLYLQEHEKERRLNYGQ